MHSIIGSASRRGTSSFPWIDKAPVREELFSAERLEQHAESLAAAQTTTKRPPRVLSLHTRLNDNASNLLAAYRASAEELRMGHGIVPAAQWLVDDYHIVEEQIREIRDDLPPGYYRQLPKLADGPFAGYPRIFGLAWAFVAHTDSHFDPIIARRFIVAYQRVQPLTIGELWAVAITLRIVLVENLRRLADQMVVGRAIRAESNLLADRLLAPGNAQSALDAYIAIRSTEPLSELFAAQLAKRLRDLDPSVTPSLNWLTTRLQSQGSSIDEVVQHAQQRQGASNVSVRNIITSMRLISEIDWAELFESVSLVDERMRSGSAFSAMDFPTRNLYRSAIEELARGSSESELDVAGHAIAASRQAQAAATDAIDAARIGDPGFHLIGEGRPALELSIAFRPTARLRLNRFSIRLGLAGYVGAIVVIAFAVLASAVWSLTGSGVASDWLILLAVISFIPTTEVATAIVNRIVAMSFGAVALPGLELLTGVPESLRTLVVVPTLLTSEADLRAQIRLLEVHHLSGVGGDLSFALLSDGVDADGEVLGDDSALIAAASQAIAELNSRHGPTAGGPRFVLLHRRRVFNASENKWMGWERKRGKLHELNRLLLGAKDTSFMTIDGREPRVPNNVRYVITLDADTRLPRDAAVKLIGKMAHPLNRPRFSEAEKRVVEGYAILQPRVTPSLPIGREGSFYQRVFSSPGGIDPYAAAISDVYQDLFGEGSYTGKGIYDVAAFEAALAGRIPENVMLSHDLFEGVFARAGLASDVELVDEFPSRYDVAAKRQHRWTRGDWQLLPWLFGRGDGAQALPMTGRWKMLDNLRRSLLGPTTLLLFGALFLLPMRAGVRGASLLVAAIALPAFLGIFFSLVPRRGVRLISHSLAVARDLRLATEQSFLSIAFLPDQSWRMGDAIARTLTRVFGTHRQLLEWRTAAQSTGTAALNLSGFYRDMSAGTALGLVIAAGALVFSPSAWPLITPFALMWLVAPALAFWSSQAPTITASNNSTHSDEQALRLTARRTWRFFETFVTPADNMLPPDNFQEDPKAVVAHRTSPTNVGLYLLSTIAARDFGWAGLMVTVERLEATFVSLAKLPKYKGHFYNWFDTSNFQVLNPAYISAVDSGNLAGHLIALANACEEWAKEVAIPDFRLGARDNLLLAREALGALPGAPPARAVQLVAALDELESGLQNPQSVESLVPTLRRLVEKARALTVFVVPGVGDEGASDLDFWIDALKANVNEYARDHLSAAAAPSRLRAIAAIAREMAISMDFAFLVEPDRKLLSLGYSVIDNRLDSRCYDLLASEARLASLFAIAKGDVPTRHWFRLGRAATPLGLGSALISWSGSMFEYLMPSLVMRAPAGSLLDQTNRLIVERQQSYAASLGLPWGISESAYNARDLQLNYQYTNFGVPGLGLTRGLSENLVIAPYATGLATMIDADGARRNYDRLAAMGGRGRYGFYDAMDFTRSRLPDGESVVVVRNYMAHHQGMTIVAIANTLLDGQMRDRFHREPMIKATELLLQERAPREIFQPRSRVEEPSASLAGATDASVARRFKAMVAGAPITHLLSNGRYAVMLTTTGGGYSRWRDIAITRWREDATRDNWGSFIFLRDRESGKVWPAGASPSTDEGANDEVLFEEDHAQFTHGDGALTTTMEVLVSGEDDSEVRRVSLTNSGRRRRVIDVTSYAELVLTSASTDNAHPAFAKMFVETEHLPEFGAIVATRRPRSPDETRVWAAHFAVVEGEISADPQYETDRARFLGRGRSVDAAPTIVDGSPLSNTVGTVLDPIFSLRYSVVVPPGAVVRVAFWTVVASTRAELLDGVDKHHERSAFDRAKTLAWTQAQVQLRHLGVETREAEDFQRLAAPILYADRRFRASSDAIARGGAQQSLLWALGVSGDLPIVLLRIDDFEDFAQVRQLLRAHEYWRTKGLGVDLVIVNESATSYLQEFQVAIETAVRGANSRSLAPGAFSQGSVHALRADLMSIGARTLLQSIARVSLIARRGSIADQLARMALPPKQVSRPDPREAIGPVQQTTARVAPPDVAVSANNLEFFNGLGGFDKDGQEYVTILHKGDVTPAPWINVIANPSFGFQVAVEGGGYTWAENSRENQLTQWSNDPVADASGEAIYIRDLATGVTWGPTAQPIRDDETYVARHGFGYSRFTHEANGIALNLSQYVPLSDPIKISRLTIKNQSGTHRRLSVTAYAEWVLGSLRGASAPFVTTDIDAVTGAMFARNPWSVAFSERIAFSDMRGRQTSWTGDRTEFLGAGGDPLSPASLRTGEPLSGAVGAGIDPCAALQCVVDIAAGETVEIVWFLGQCASILDARNLIARYRDADLDAVLKEVTEHWSHVLGAVKVKTPDRSMDIMLNGWLLYQTLACRVWARSAFYQASGAYGFRDQLQDGMALTFAMPAETRRHLLRAAARQFVEGDVQHWWLPQSGRGVRTQISDDRVWLAFAAASYIVASGDMAVLDEVIPFLEGPMLSAGQHDNFFQPMIADESGSLFEHCARGLDQSVALTGAHGLPLMGTGDWNDGMNRVGEGGKGESVWLGWLFSRAVEMFAPLARHRDPERVQRWESHARAVNAAIEANAWDGDWYRRATFDDGTWLGSKENDECRIDSIAQSWAVLSGAAEPARAASAMASVEKHLVRHEDKLALLFAPPFDKTSKEPGYIKGYPPGLRENGGQYSHAAMWAILAFAKLGDGDKAVKLFALLNPINHANSPEAVSRYKVEPYVVAADVYSVAPHVGRGGWTWYTGSAAWMYRAGVEGILGIRREGDFLIVEPGIPVDWSRFEATMRIGASVYEIRVENQSDSITTLDGSPIACEMGRVQIPIEGANHKLKICLPVRRSVGVAAATF